MGIGAIEDRLTGSEERLRELYRGAFSETEAERFVRETKKQNRRVALLILLVSAVFAVSGITGMGGDEEKGLDLERPGAGDAPKTIVADVSAEYNGYTERQRASVRILPREPSGAEAGEMLKALEQRLPGLILGENVSLDSVMSDLVLPYADGETGAELSWLSSDPRIISNDGRVNLVGAGPGSVVTLTAHIRLASVQDTFYIAVKTGAGVPDGGMGGALKDRLAEAVKTASSARDGEAASLPEVTEDGVRLTWAAPERTGGMSMTFGCVVIALLCFSQRYRAAARNIEKARAEMERDFPDFIQKLGLLLGAGLVITSAIARISDDYLRTRDVYGRRRLYEELAAAQERMRAAGTSLVFEFSELARRSGLRELMRFSSTLADNIDKGSTLSEKLRAESGLLWEGRKKRAEKEGRIAETKLIFPMALQILAVIAITVMPAAFEMG
ncbi:MAG: type II secretion system F family protein [Clostridiales bacterium]|nr:type II secretion system F family protein [Clostridiales bacterium]